MIENHDAAKAPGIRTNWPPLRILLVDHADFLGGAEVNALALLTAIDTARYQITLACPAGALLSAASALRARTTPLTLPRLRGAGNMLMAPVNFFKSTGELVRLIQNERIEIVHSNTMRAAVYASAASRRAGTKFVWHVHDLHRARSFVWLMSAAAHAIIANSQAVAQTVPSFARPKTTVVYNGISLSDFDRRTTDGQAFRIECGVPDSGALIGTIGWIAPWKGHRDFIYAAARIAAQDNLARFVIVGAVTDSRYQAYVQEMRALGQRLLGDKLIWAGERTPMQPVLAGLDVVLHCAEREPFGRVLIEAMAMQVPVVAFSGGGPDEIIDQGKTGFLIPAGDTNGMAAAAVGLLADPGARQKMGKAGRERACALFNSATIARQVELVYDRLGAVR